MTGGKFPRSGILTLWWVPLCRRYGQRVCGTPFVRRASSLWNIKMTSVFKEKTMTQTIYATFPTERDAERAVGALMDHGVSSIDISFIVPDRFEPVQTEFAGGY